MEYMIAKVDHTRGTTLFFWLLVGAQKLICIMISITTSSTKEIRRQMVFVGRLLEK